MLTWSQQLRSSSASSLYREITLETKRKIHTITCPKMQLAAVDGSWIMGFQCLGYEIAAFEKFFFPPFGQESILSHRNGFCTAWVEHYIGFLGLAASRMTADS